MMTSEYKNLVLQNVVQKDKEMTTISSIVVSEKMRAFYTCWSHNFENQSNEDWACSYFNYIMQNLK